MSIRIAAISLVVVACGPQVLVPVDDDGDATTTASTTDLSTTAMDTGSTSPPTSVGTSEPPNPSTTIDPDTTTIDPETTDDPTADSVMFIADPEVACSLCFDCDLWAQDCPRGEKCMPWANDGGNAWNAARCTPLEDDPDQIDDPCTVEGSGVSGIDSCDIAAMCWNVGPDTNTGTCVPFCGGSEANPTCDAACETCNIANDGYLILCLPVCDPSAGACPDPQVCAPVDAVFLCVSVGATVELGEVCDDATPCADGLRCTAANELPSCAGAACCAPWCSEADADPCAAMPGTTCEAVDFGEVPGCVETIGYCATN